MDFFFFLQSAALTLGKQVALLLRMVCSKGSSERAVGTYKSFTWRMVSRKDGANRAGKEEILPPGPKDVLGNFSQCVCWY